MNTNLNEVYQYHHYRHDELVKAADQHRMANAQHEPRPSLLANTLLRTGVVLTNVGNALLERYGDAASTPQPATQSR